MHKKYLNPLILIHFNLKNISKSIYNVSFLLKTNIDKSLKKNNVLNHFALNLLFPGSYIYSNNIINEHFLININQKNIKTSKLLRKLISRKIKNNYNIAITNIYKQLEIKIFKLYFKNLESNVQIFIKYKNNIKILKFIYNLI